MWPGNLGTEAEVGLSLKVALRAMIEPPHSIEGAV